MPMDTRIDKFLWSVRLFKTRTQAAEACKKGRVLIGRALVKASHVINAGDIIGIKRPPITYVFRVLDIPSSRLGAKLVEHYLQNITSADQIALLDIIKVDKQNQRAKGLGRPTKKERRHIDNLINSQPYFIDEDESWEVE